MKKIFSLLILFILISSNVSAICLFGLGNCDKVVGFNPLFDYEEGKILESMSLREVLEYKIEDIEREMPTKMVKIGLPLTMLVEIEDNENFCVVINKKGKVFVLDVCGNEDVIIKGGEEELKNLFVTETNQELIDKVIDLEIKAISFKGKLITQIIENYFGMKIVKDKSTSQKIMSIVVVPIVGVVKT